MFSLAYPLIETVEIDGVGYDLDASFDNIIRMIDMLNDKELNDSIQIILGLQMFIGIDLEIDIQKKAEIFYQLFKEVIGSNEEDELELDIAGNPMPKNEDSEENGEVYSLSKDAEYIYASFMSEYKIDLFEEQGKLGWDKFKALLTGLSDDSIFKRVVEIRACDLPSGKGTAKERERLIKLKKRYAIKR